MEKSEILAKIVEVARRVLPAEGLDMVHAELERQRGGWLLRFTIDRPGGVTLDDCERASHQLGAELDVLDAIPGSYTLEVSSPGLDRPLRDDEDYRRFAGRRVVINTYEPVQGRRHFVGRLESLVEEVVTLTDDRGLQFFIPRKTISKARLEVEF